MTSTRDRSLDRKLFAGAFAFACLPLGVACVMDAATEEDQAGLFRRPGAVFGGGGELVLEPDPPFDDDGVPHKRFNGPDPNGPSDDLRLLRYALNASTFTNQNTGVVRLRLSGGQIGARYALMTRWGVNLVDTQVTGQLVNGTTVTLRFFDVDQDPTNANLWDYDVRVWQDDAWYPACGTNDDGTPRRALAMPNRYDFTYLAGATQVDVSGTGAKIVDANAITLACRGYAFAKCEEFYPPWQWNAAAGANLSDHHWACVRALRADVCGDGTAHTHDGLVLNVYDNIGLIADTKDWPLEGIWGTSGARCLNPDAREELDKVLCPQSPPGCEGTSAPGGLVLTEYD